MALMNGEEYRASLRNRRPLRVFFDGEQLTEPYDHPVIKAVDAV